MNISNDAQKNILNKMYKGEQLSDEEKKLQGKIPLDLILQVQEQALNKPVPQATPSTPPPSAPAKPAYQFGKDDKYKQFVNMYADGKDEFTTLNQKPNKTTADWARMGELLKSKQSTSLTPNAVLPNKGVASDVPAIAGKIAQGAAAVPAPVASKIAAGQKTRLPSTTAQIDAMARPPEPGELLQDPLNVKETIPGIKMGTLSAGPSTEVPSAEGPVTGKPLSEWDKAGEKFQMEGVPVVLPSSAELGKKEREAPKAPVPEAPAPGLPVPEAPAPGLPVQEAPAPKTPASEAPVPGLPAQEAFGVPKTTEPAKEAPATEPAKAAGASKKEKALDLIANLIDIMGVTMSAKGGVQRETRLQQQFKTELQKDVIQKQADADQQKEIAINNAGAANQMKLIEKQAKEQAAAQIKAMGGTRTELEKAVIEKQFEEQLKYQSELLPIELKYQLRLIDEQTEKEALAQIKRMGGNVKEVQAALQEQGLRLGSAYDIATRVGATKGTFWYDIFQSIAGGVGTGLGRGVAGAMIP